MRSGDMSLLTADDVNLLQERFGVACFLDLRTNEERARRPFHHGWQASGARLLSFPLGDFPAAFRQKGRPEPSDYAAYYLDLLQGNGETVRSLLLFMTRELGLRRFVFGCSAGKDRTGVVAFLLLSLAGAAPETIVEDYALTTAFNRANLEYFRPHWEKRGMTPEEYAERIAARPEIIRLFAEGITRSYGGVVGYLHSVGLELNEIEAMQRFLQTSALQ